MKKLYLFILLPLFIACNSGAPQSDLLDLDLMKHGLPIKIKAPEGAEVEVSDLGFVKDAVIKAGDDFYVQVIEGVALSSDIETIKNDHLSEVKNNEFFDEILLEEEAGFIFRKRITEERINHDFRLIKVQGNKEYVFQTGLTGNYSQKDVERMFEAVK